MRVGQCVSYDRDIGRLEAPGAIKRGDRLELFVDGVKSAESTASKNAIDLDPFQRGQPLHSGFGEKAYFSGKIREVRVYRSALDSAAIERLKEAVRPE